MTSPFKKPSEVSGGSFFTPKSYSDAKALLIEPTHVEKDVPNTYNGVTKNRDEVTATVTVFKTSEALETGTPTDVLKDVRIGHPGIANPAARVLDGALVATVAMIPPKNGGASYWGLRDVDTTTEGQVAEYYTKREAAKAEALASVPGFD